MAHSHVKYNGSACVQDNIFLALSYVEHTVVRLYKKDILLHVWTWNIS